MRFEQIELELTWVGVHADRRQRKTRERSTQWGV